MVEMSASGMLHTVSLDLQCKFESFQSPAILTVTDAVKPRYLWHLLRLLDLYPSSLWRISDSSRADYSGGSDCQGASACEGSIG